MVSLMFMNNDVWYVAGFTDRTATQRPCPKQSKAWRGKSVFLCSKILLFWRPFYPRDFFNILLWILNSQLHKQKREKLLDKNLPDSKAIYGITNQGVCGFVFKKWASWSCSSRESMLIEHQKKKKKNSNYYIIILWYPIKVYIL